MADTRRPELAPMRVNDYLPIVVGTVCWAIAFIVLATQHHAMAARGQGWWLWVALTGFGLGLWGMVLISLHHRSQRRAADRAAGRAAETSPAENS